MSTKGEEEPKPGRLQASVSHVLSIEHVADGGMDFAIGIPIDDDQTARTNEEFFEVFQRFIENDFKREGRGIAKIFAITVRPNSRE